MRSPVAPRGPLWAAPVALCFVLAASCSDGGGDASDDEGNAGEDGSAGEGTLGGMGGNGSGGKGGTGSGGKGGASGGGGAEGGEGNSGGTGGDGSGGKGGASAGDGGAVGGVGGAGSAGVAGSSGAVAGADAGGAFAGGGGAGFGGTVGGSAGTPAGGSSAGTPATGGVGGVTAGTGGGAGTGGSAGSGSVPCESSMVIGSDGFVRAPGASGCWHGYASAGGDSTSMVMPTSFATCGVGCMLKASGTVGAAVEPTYAGVVYLGFNLNEATGGTKGTVVPTGAGLAVTYTNTGASPVVRVHVSAGTIRWCAPLMTSGATIPWTTFNTQCWEGGMGTAYAKEAIDTVQLIIPGGAADAPFDITLVSVKDT